MQWICLLTSGGWQNKFKVWPSHIVDHKVRFKSKTIYTYTCNIRLSVNVKQQQHNRWSGLKKHSALQRSLTTTPSYASRSSVCSLDMQSWPPVWRYNTTMEGEYLWGLAAKSRYGEYHTLPYWALRPCTQFKCYEAPISFYSFFCGYSAFIEYIHIKPNSHCQ